MTPTLATVLTFMLLAALISLHVLLWRAVRALLTLGTALRDALNVPAPPVERHGWAPPRPEVLDRLRGGASEVRLADSDPLVGGWDAEAGR